MPAMQIGVPREIKIGETRVSMTPSLCRRCVTLGAKVLVEKSAGLSAGFIDAEYRDAGATLTASAPKVWAAADLILKDAKPLEHNAYKVPLAHALIRRTLLALKG